MGVPSVSYASTAAAGPHGPQFETKTADYTVTADDHGKIFVTGAADLVFTLPAASAAAEGFTVTVLVSTLSTTTGASVSPNSADKINGNGFTAADDKDAINTAATDAVGDWITVSCDGTDWWVTGVNGTWAREA